MSPIATMRPLDATTGAVRVEDVYDTDIDDLWQACTTSERLARWVAQVSGDLRPGGTVEVTFTSSWSGTARVERCDAPHHLLLRTSSPDGGEEGWIEAWLTTEDDGTRLVVEERGLPLEVLHHHAAGWHTHLEDLGRALALDATAHPEGWSTDRPAPRWEHRWTELAPAYEAVGLA
ncbi:SRPBCC domain-containing protein [Cellulomonas wangsupingiae]|uniref:SRPBCC domain-containing protein n=1 Tax=Cellulomonas wangsupingiae TaxID=2968085 RepID=A0ABY5K4U5_9CELL|nr:SRPBCC domain-containing protein [Cellulomonas wangsupingiae]MCC2333822.1 SRPBCC domain-containing protein [Cellulomonas wangsupingiae]UUI65083.1 SRPBCC domain-containing protein [Cellulomonas wangsupingiae]